VVLGELRQRHLKEGQQTRFFVLGHSMGGIFAAHLAAKHADLLDGVLFLNPWVRDSARVPPGMLLGILAGGLLHSRRHWRNPGGVEGMTTNPEAIRMLEADPYWRRDLTATFFMQIMRLRTQMPVLAPKIHLPALVLQAEQDKSVIASASQQFYTALASSDKTWKLYPDYAHDTELEPERARLDRDIVEWIQAH
jgi:alpha-beta hydrolase superfamily lysophospholipase